MFGSLQRMLIMWNQFKKLKNNNLPYQGIKSMNNRINNFLLVGDRSMPEMHSRQPIFTYSPCGTFTKTKNTLKKLGKL